MVLLFIGSRLLVKNAENGQVYWTQSFNDSQKLHLVVVLVAGFSYDVMKKQAVGLADFWTTFICRLSKRVLQKLFEVLRFDILL